MTTIITNGYKAEVKYSEHDKCFYGKITGIPDLVLFEANDVEDVHDEFKIAIEDYKETLKDINR